MSEAKEVTFKSPILGWGVWCGGKKIKFRKGEYKTSDQREIDFLRDPKFAKECTIVPDLVPVKAPPPFVAVDPVAPVPVPEVPPVSVPEKETPPPDEVKAPPSKGSGKKDK